MRLSRPPRSSSRARREWPRARLAFLALFVAAGIWLLAPAYAHRSAPDHGPPAAAPPPPVTGTVTATSRPAAPPGPRRALERTGRDEPAAPSNDEGRAVQRAERVSRALDLLRYAPGSQPLRADMVDVLQPNRRYETTMPLALATGGPGSSTGDGDLSFLLTGDRFRVVGADALTATLEVFRARAGDPGGSARGDRDRVSAVVTKAFLVVVDGDGAHTLSTALAMNDDGRDGDAAAGDKIYGLRVVPSAIPQLAGRHGLVRLVVDFNAAEGEPRPGQASIDFDVTSSPPAVVAGVTSEHLTEGGLEIGVAVDVDVPGSYFLQGLLFDARGAPIGFAVARPSLPAGRATVTFQYWGLLFREAEAAGPYVFRTVTGRRLPSPGEADGAEMAVWDGAYRTQPYAVTDFSDKEYESAAKDLKVQALAALAARNPARAPAAGPP